MTSNTSGASAGGMHAAGGQQPVCGRPPDLFYSRFMNVTLGALGDAGSEGGAGGEQGSSCTEVWPDDVIHTACRGGARVTSVDPELVFELGDGSLLAWNAHPDSPRPNVGLGDAVFVDLEQTVQITCGVCQNAKIAWTLSLRDDDRGAVLWTGAVGETRADIEQAALAELFGSAVRSEPACSSSPFEAGCYNVVVDVFDHVIETDPEQRVPYGIPRRVTTPSGTFDVLWATGNIAGTRLANCHDGYIPERIREYAASRVLD